MINCFVTGDCCKQIGFVNLISMLNVNTKCSTMDSILPCRVPIEQEKLMVVCGSFNDYIQA
ncbi:CLUMA_CG013575, isoform A [Clunio marinus]|uniref:CLUMA_CG013575, isoform A n=1 Tax=Clunio marinus TaxID=568069 RepID=A0A1J1IMI9_9DIPT|nr:CLUMA_CG013575, isoform A [Clunio marinus]